MTEKTRTCLTQVIILADRTKGIHVPEEPVPGFKRHVLPEHADLLEQAGAFRRMMEGRRSVREFSARDVPESVVRELVRTAGTAPSGANKQPWRFVAVKDAELKSEIRLAAEEEERLFYEKRASENWLEDLKPFMTDSEKPFLEIAPWLIIVFKVMGPDPDQPVEGDNGRVYYVNESVGIACGLFLAAAHNAGLATLTHTPSPMKFLTGILERPSNERPFLVIPLGYPAVDCMVPDIARKDIDQIMTVDRGTDQSTPG
jgi:iodotyrosine deiodinase